MDIRLRIAVELMTHRELYLDANYLSKGLQEGQTLTAKTVAQFSDRYKGQFLDEDTVNEIYQQEIHQVLRPQEFMGVWQLFALSSVLSIPIVSIYPNKSPSVRKDLHRIILPRSQSSSLLNKPAYIMWSSARKDMQDAFWVPNHFCPVLPLQMISREEPCSPDHHDADK
jgi:hypothetical protein